MKAVVVVLLLSSSFVPGSHQQCISANDSFHDFSLDKLTELSKDQQTFSIKMLRLLALAEPTRNVMVSTYSVYQGLLLLYFGAAGQTERSLRTVLNIANAQSKVDALELYREEKYQIGKNYNYYVRNANRIYVSNRFKIRRCLLRKIPTDIRPIDFSRNPQRAKKIITSWQRRQTGTNVKSAITKLPPSTTMVLVNAAHFRGHWNAAFNTGEIRSEYFYVTPSNRILTSMLVHKRNDTVKFKTFKNKEFRILELPFKHRDNSMIILLPTVHKLGDVNQMIKRINRNFLTLISDPKKFREESMDVQIPKFTVHNTVDLGEILQFMGIEKGLTRDADYSRFTGKRGLYPGFFIHDALLDFAIGRPPTIRRTPSSLTKPPLNSFICNRPFVYVIYNKMVKKILNVGIFRAALPRARPSLTR